MIRKILINIGRPIYRWEKWWFLIWKNLILQSWKTIGKVKFKVKVARKPITKTGPVSLGRIFNRSWFWCGLSLLALAGSGGCWWFYDRILKDLPSINQIYVPPNLTTRVLDRDGKLLYKFYKGENRSWTSLKEIPQSLVWATIAIEDKEFFRHHGLSLKGIAKALIYNFKRDSGTKLRGGSTITQQLVKNVFLGQEKTWERKIKEAILTLWLERRFSKEEILERYFNQVAYGGETYGAQEAAWKYFNKNVWELDMSQAAFLAGLPAAPSSYSPFGPNPEYAILRQHHVIEEMVSGGFITQEKGMELKEIELEIAENRKNIQAPHFVFYVKNLLENNYGFINFEKRGLTVSTSLDLEIQEMAQRVVKEEIDKVSRLRISNGAALVIDIKKGEILAMVGSKDYDAGDIDGKFNVTTALRQPGSLIKPINYLLAFMNGKSLASTIEDSPITYHVAGQNPYSPKNYNGKYMGKVTLKTALASSLNVPSVKLLSENGVSNMIDLAQSMGISTWGDRNRYGLALALGSGEVRMIELAGAYSIFGNLGNKVEINPILGVKNYLGEKVYERTEGEVGVIDPKYAFLVNMALSDNQARTPIFGPNSMLKIDGKTVAVKTGTTNNLKDNWCMGWTPTYLVAAWVGNNDSSPMSWVASGISGATPIWHRIMKEVLAEMPDEKWELPLGVYRASACGNEEYFVDGTEKQISCIKQEGEIDKETD